MYEGDKIIPGGQSTLASCATLDVARRHLLIEYEAAATTGMKEVINYEG